MDPSSADAWFDRGEAYLHRGDLSEAIGCYERALELSPGYAPAHNSIGVVHARLGRWDEALEPLRHAIQAKPDYAEAYNNLSIVYSQLQQYAPAEAQLRTAIRLRPDFPQAHYNLGNALAAQGKLAEGVASFDSAIQLQPDYPKARLDRAFAWLRMGDFERGWPEFEWRWRHPDFAPRPFPQPCWNGSALGGRTILLHAEQGLGDTLHFIRYAPLVKAKGGRVLVECQEPLAELLATCEGIDDLVVRGKPLPVFDMHAPLLSLPRIFGTALTTIPDRVPYLNADTDLVESWRKELKSLPGYKLGVAWQGSPRNPHDRKRSVELPRFAHIAQRAKIALISLQEGAGTEQLRDVPTGIQVIDLGSRFETFADAAAALMNLDLTITVDSAIAHCAGALGLPVWVLLPFASDWRWLMDREDSPWYPSMRLFRQRLPGDWDELFQRVEGALKRDIRKPPGNQRMESP